MKASEIMEKHQSSGARNMRMRMWSGLKRTITACICVALVCQAQVVVAAGQEPTPQPKRVQQDVSRAIASSPPQNVGPAREDPIPAAPIPQLAQEAQPTQQPSAPQQPVGTAAAPYEKPTGVPGSRPAGAAIAPAKQRRVRTIVIRVGLVLAGAGAVGAVIGLSKASHSEP
jgi:hypothetical protein